MEQTQTQQPQQQRFNRGGHGGHRGRDGGRRPPKEQSEFDSAVLNIARVTRVTGGGKRFSFRTTVVLGNKKGKIGMGIAKGVDVAQSIQKATNQAKRNMILIPIKNGTIPHEVQNKSNSAIVLLKPAVVGSGVKAGGPVRIIAKLSGIENVVGKLISRTNNKINIARATIEALSQLKGEDQKQKPVK